MAVGNWRLFGTIILLQSQCKMAKKDLVLSADQIFLTAYFMTHILVAVIVTLLAIYGGLKWHVTCLVHMDNVMREGK